MEHSQWHLWAPQSQPFWQLWQAPLHNGIRLNPRINIGENRHVDPRLFKGELFANLPSIFLNIVMTKMERERPTITLITPNCKQVWYNKPFKLSSSYINLGPGQATFTTHLKEANKTLLSNWRVIVFGGRDLVCENKWGVGEKEDGAKGWDCTNSINDQNRKSGILKRKIFCYLLKIYLIVLNVIRSYSRRPVLAICLLWSTKPINFLQVDRQDELVLVKYIKINKREIS